MLYELSLSVDFLAMGVTLWLAFYLLGRGFPSRLSIKAVILLLSLSGFFSSAYLNLIEPNPGTATLRALLLILGLCMWFNIAHQLSREFGGLSDTRIAFAVYAAGAAAGAALLAAGSPFTHEEQNLRVGQMDFGIPLMIYGVFQLVVAAGVLIVLARRSRFGRMRQGRYFLVAALATSAAIAYGLSALSLPVTSPRVVQDALIFLGVSLMGLAIARHQVLVERRTEMRDLPVSGASTLGLAGLYALAVHALAGDEHLTGLTFLAAIATHSLHELTREYLERRRQRDEAEFRRQWRELGPRKEATGGKDYDLQNALELLCRELDASSGLIARRSSEVFEVAASVNSLPVGSVFNVSVPEELEDLLPLDHLPDLPDLRWLAPVSGHQGLTGALAIGPIRRGLRYTRDALDLLVDAANRIELLITAGTQDPADDAARRAGPMLNLLRDRPDEDFVKVVESALRALSDYSALGQHALAEWAGIAGDTHVARGKALREFLVAGIEGMRPEGERPPEPLPREWYPFAILYDAYVEDVKNNEIMARLYVSEGTFNRARRNALRGLAQSLREMRAADNGER